MSRWRHNDEHKQWLTMKLRSLSGEVCRVGFDLRLWFMLTLMTVCNSWHHPAKTTPILFTPCGYDKAPSYLADDLHWTDEAGSRHRLRSGSCPRLIVPRTRLSTIGDRKHGTVFLPTSLHQLLYRLSKDNLKHFYLPNLSHHFKLLSHIFCTVS